MIEGPLCWNCQLQCHWVAWEKQGPSEWHCSGHHEEKHKFPACSHLERPPRADLSWNGGDKRRKQEEERNRCLIPNLVCKIDTSTRAGGKTVSSVFLVDLAALMSTLNDTDPHFVRYWDQLGGIYFLPICPNTLLTFKYTMEDYHLFVHCPGA